jgi:hypothetical protein
VPRRTTPRSRAGRSWRAQGAGRIDPESAAPIKLLCAGALRGRPACDTVFAIEAPASGR